MYLWLVLVLCYRGSVTYARQPLESYVCSPTIGEPDKSHDLRRKLEVEILMMVMMMLSQCIIMYGRFSRLRRRCARAI